MTALDEIHERAVALAAECGDVEVHRSGSTTELRAPRTFATIETGTRSVEVHLMLPTGRRVPGVVRLLHGPAAATTRHTLRLRRTEDVDDELRAWLCEAWTLARE